MKGLSALRRTASDEVPAADYIPFGAHIAPDVTHRQI